MSSKEIVKPVIEDGIEFYCSKITGLKGISQVGTARLCGVSEFELRRLVASLVVRQDETKARRSEIPEALEHLVGTELSLDISSRNQAKVLDSKVVASIVSYYAFEKNNKTAKYSLQKFASIGVDTWIETVTGALDSSSSMALLESINKTMGKMMVKLENLEKIEADTAGYRKATVTMPVLEKWMKELDQESKDKLLAPSEELLSIKEAMVELKPHLAYSPVIARGLALKVGQTIAALTGEPVPKTTAKSTRGDNMLVNGYSRAQLPLIKLCYNAVLSED